MKTFKTFKMKYPNHFFHRKKSRSKKNWRINKKVIKITSRVIFLVLSHYAMRSILLLLLLILI